MRRFVFLSKQLHFSSIHNFLKIRKKEKISQADPQKIL